MADFSALKQSIQNYIKQNGNKEITGNLLQTILLSMVTTMGDGAINDNASDISDIQNEIQNITGALYAGYATPSTMPAALTGQEVFYIATQAGTYTDFHFNGGDDPIVLTKDGIYFIVSGNDDDDWNAEPILQLDDKPTASSNNAVKSGGVAEELALGAVYDVSAHNNGATFASLSALLGDANLNTLIPTTARKGGMSIKFVCSFDNKYVQARCMAQNFTTDVTQWQVVDDEPTAGSDNLVKSGGVYKELYGILHFINGYWLTSYAALEEDEDAGVSDYIPYTQGNDVIWRFDSQTHTYCLCLYDEQKHFINGAYWSGSFSSEIQGRKITSAEIAQYAPNAAYIRCTFTLAYENATVIVGENVAWVPYANGIKGDIEELKVNVDSLNLEVAGIKEEIQEADELFYKEVEIPIDIEVGAVENKYLIKNTAAVGSYSGYNISAPIHLLDGESIRGTIFANDVCLLASTDAQGSSYTFIANSEDGALHNTIDYQASNDMYIVVCYKAGESYNSIAKITTENGKLTDIAEQVKKNEDDIAELEKVQDEISDACEKYGEATTEVDIVTGAVVGKYLAANTAAIGTETNYNISAPIHLAEGASLTGKLRANDVCMIAETDSDGGNYVFIENSYTAGLNTVNYVASRDIYIAVCYNNTFSDNELYKTGIATMEDVFEQVKKNKDDITTLMNYGVIIPDFVVAESTETFKRYQKWKGSDKCLVFPIITDLHATPSNVNSLKPNNYIVATDRIFGYSFIANLGDIGLGNDASPTQTKALTILNKTAEAMNDYSGKIFFAQGNHDSDFKTSLGFGQTDVDNYLGCTLTHRFPEFAKKNHSHQCFYADFEDLKIRVYVVNTTDKSGGGNYGMTAEQLNWIKSSLLLTPTGYCVLFLSHFCIQKIGEWKSYISSDEYAYGSDNVLKAYANMLTAFANKTSVTFGDYSFDFTGVDSSIKLIGNICGDSHFDAQLSKDGSQVVPKIVDGQEQNITIYGNGVNYIITQGYGSISPSELPSWAVYTQFNRSENVLFDVVAIKPESKEMKIFRIGAGGENRDRSFSF